MGVGEFKPTSLRFGIFELNLATGELRKAGLLTKLAPQPAKVLGLIASRRGELVTREEIQREIWGGSTFVDFDQGVNHCIKQIRNTLNDNAESPRYIETLPRRGYRFIAPVEELRNFQAAEAVARPGKPEQETPQTPSVINPDGRNHFRRWRRLVAGMAAAALAVALGAAVWIAQRDSAPRSIAVLPFEDMSAEKNQQYLSEGLSDELRNELAQVEQLRVTGTTSSNQFRGRSEDARSIGRKLRVGTLLEGSVRRQGNRARINVQLIKTADGFQLWAERYEKDIGDVFALEDEISRAVIAALRVKLLAGRTTPSSHMTNAEVWDAYLRGRYLYGKRTKDDLYKASRLFEQATTLDPHYAPAWAALARCRQTQGDRGYAQEREAYEQARQAADRALALDDHLAEAYAVQGLIRKNHDWDWTGAESSYRRALQFAPGDPLVIGELGDSAWIAGRIDEAVTFYRKAIELEPRDNNLYFGFGLVLISGRRFEEAREALNQALELAPQMEEAHFALCLVDLVQSRAREALGEALKEKHPVFGLLGPVLAYDALGRRSESDAALSQLIAKFGNEDPYQIADAYARRGEAGKAFEWLERAWLARDAGLVELKVDPLLSNIRNDPRYAALLKRMRLPR